MTWARFALRTRLIAGASLLVALCIVSPSSADEGPKNCPNGICTAKAQKKGDSGGSSTSGGSRGASNQSMFSGSRRSGPSKLEIARKQEKAIDRAVNRYLAAQRSYSSCLARRAESSVCGNLIARGGGANLTGAQVVLTGQPRPAGAAPLPTITPAQAGAMAVAQLRLPINTPGIGPDPNKNEWKMAAIGYPLWLWADGPTHVGPVGQNVGGLTVSLEASLSKTVFRMGDGHSVTCRGGGKPYASWVQPGAKSPNCGYVYEKPSLPSKNYKVTAIAYWDVTWSINGVSGVIQVPRVGSTDLPVGELQAIVVR